MNSKFKNFITSAEGIHLERLNAATFPSKMVPVKGHPSYFFQSDMVDRPQEFLSIEADTTVHDEDDTTSLDETSMGGVECTGFDDISRDGLASIGFIYEEPMSSYWKMKPRLDGLGAFSYERWTEMCCIHFILPNMTTTGQATTAKQANLPHYQTSLEHITSQVQAFRETGGQIEFNIYQPDRDYSNNFMHVTNSGLPEIQTIDWKSISALAYKATKSDNKRQHKFKDFGTTGGQCTTRVGSQCGVGIPRKKETRYK